jgi:hypothetical protein
MRYVIKTYTLNLYYSLILRKGCHAGLQLPSGRHTMLSIFGDRYGNSENERIMARPWFSCPSAAAGPG